MKCLFIFLCVGDGLTTFSYGSNDMENDSLEKNGVFDVEYS